MKKRTKAFFVLTLFCITLFSGCQNKEEFNQITADSSKESESADVSTEQEIEQESEINEEVIDTGMTEQEPYHYVAFGNSVTYGEVTEDIWWGDWGMAASSKENDYVHLISNELEQTLFRPVVTEVYSLKSWELASDRTSVLEELNETLDESTDLVTIQSGENITQYQETLEIDYFDLLSFVRKKAPNAQVLMLGELLWPSENIETAKQTACEACEVTFVDMTQFLNDYDAFYKSSLGTEIVGADGSLHVIEDEEVAAHPNDEGMECIAIQVLSYIYK